MKKKPKKPKDFPLTANGNGQWSKKIRGKVYYFGKWDRPDEALSRYLAERDYLIAGQQPPNEVGHTILELFDRFVANRRMKLDSDEISPRMVNDYKKNCQLICDFAGDWIVESMTPDDFARIRKYLAKDVGITTLGNRIRMARVAFAYIEEITQTKNNAGVRPAWGKQFREPSARMKRKAKSERGKMMHTAEEIRNAVEAAKNPQVKAMIYLGINCGWQNCDCGEVTWNKLDLDGGWHEFERPKTYIPRRAKLWDETIEALKAVPAKGDRVFVTKYGNKWSDTAIQHEVSDFGLKFSWLRKTFRTVADRTGETEACRLVMGHAAGNFDMDNVYIQEIWDEKLIFVSRYVRGWLLGG